MSVASPLDVDSPQQGSPHPGAPQAAQPRIRTLLLRGSIIELFGYGTGLVLRLVSNLILSRLLFPEAYGLTAIVTVFMVALGMLSDVGLRESVVNSNRGTDPVFLDTVWSIRIVRGFGLWVLSAMIAWPVALIYGEPQLLPLLVVAGFAHVLQSLESTVMFTLTREVRRGPIVVVTLIGKILSMVVMFAWAYVSPSVWALVAGGLVGPAITSAASYFVPGQHRNRLRWDRSSAKEVTSFGKWILGSSALTFASREGDQLLFGWFLPMATLGVYSIALTLSSAIGLAVVQLSSSVVYGVLGQVVRTKRHELGRHYYGAKLPLDLMALPPLGALVILGPAAVSILYDTRYHEAGWMLSVLCSRVILACMTGPSSFCLMALGEPQHSVKGNIGRFAVIWVGIPLGFWLGGLPGALVATVVSELPMVAVLWAALARHHMLNLKRETLAIALAGGGALLGWIIDVTILEWLLELVKG